MASEKDVFDVLRAYVDSRLNSAVPKYVWGTWTGVNASDSNLSVVVIDGTTFDYIPKLANTTSLVTGDRILLLNAPGHPLVIIDKVVGNNTLTVNLG